MSPIAIHFECLMSKEVQEEIGCLSDKDEHLRVMRLLAAYDELRAENAALLDELTEAVELLKRSNDCLEREQADNAALREEVERLEKDRVNHDLLDERNRLLEDAELLDWLEAGPNRHVIGEVGCTGAPFFICQDRDRVETAACGAATVRGAIRKARAALEAKQ